MSARRAGGGPWSILAVAVVAQVGVSVIDQGIPTLTGFIKDDLDLSAFEAGLVVSSFAAGRIVGSYAAGLAADRIGERTVLAAGALAAAAFVFAASLASLPLFAFLLLLAGAAGAASTPAGGRLVLLAFPPDRHGIALGIRQTGIPLGGLIAAAIAALGGAQRRLAVEPGRGCRAHLPRRRAAAAGRRAPDGRAARADGTARRAGAAEPDDPPPHRLGLPDRHRPVRGRRLPRARRPPRLDAHAGPSLAARRRRERRRDRRPGRLGRGERPAARPRPEAASARGEPRRRDSGRSSCARCRPRRRWSCSSPSPSSPG